MTSALMPVPEAMQRILDGAVPLASEAAALADAFRRVLAADVAATLTQPPFPASAMDGYAVRAGDCATPGTRLVVTGMSAAGHPFAGRLGPGEAVRIFTGAPVPEGADAIVIQEEAEREGDHVRFSTAPSPGAHLRPAGLDFRQGQVLLKAGRRLTARDLSLAAAMGHPTLPVRRRPRIALLATGDELVEPGTRPGAGQIVSSTPYGLAAMIEAAGGAATRLGIAADTLASLEQHFAKAGQADVLVTIGGASVGDHDLVQKALAARGLALAFWKIAMRPGKPLMFGRLGGQRVLGLPGNPVSAMLCARVFLVPLIRALTGEAGGTEPERLLPLEHPLEANGPRQHYMRAVLQGPAGAPRIATPGNQDSSLIATLAEADCLIVRPPGAPAAEAGTPVPVLSMEP